MTRLKTETMITTATATGQLVITICNYDAYQSDDVAPATATATPNATAPRQHRDSTATKKKEGLIRLKKVKVSKQDARAIVFDILSKVASIDAVNGFIEMRWNIKAPMTERAAHLVADKLVGKMNADAILDLSTENNWKSVFPHSSN